MTPLPVAVFFSALRLAPSGAVQVKLPELSQLVAAVRSRDDIEIERVAARLGPAKLRKVAEHGRRDEKLAALRALSMVAGAWAELPDLARLAGGDDTELALAAAHCAQRIAERMSPETMEAEEVPRDVPRRAAQAFLQLAGRTELTASLRAAALQAAAALRGVIKIDDAAIAKLLASDEQPAVRRAAAEALYFAPVPQMAPRLPSPPSPARATLPPRATTTGPRVASVIPTSPVRATIPSTLPPEAQVEQALAGALLDASPEVAAAAAASLCRDVPNTLGPSRSPAEARAARVAPPARARLRALAIDETLALADRLDLVACLRVFGGSDDKKTLDELANLKPEALKRRARALGGR